VASDPIQWLLATCGWVILEVVSSLTEFGESQQQLHGDGLHQEHCVRWMWPKYLKRRSVTILETGDVYALHAGSAAQEQMYHFFLGILIRESALCVVRNGWSIDADSAECFSVARTRRHLELRH